MLIGVPVISFCAWIGVVWSHSQEDEAPIVAFPMFAVAVLGLIGFEIGPACLLWSGRRVRHRRQPESE
jgi:hypothetical protein